MSTRIENIEIVSNKSSLEDRLVAYKAKEHQWRPGLHAILIQDRYGDGPFFFDWRPIQDVGEARYPDWNVVVRVHGRP